MSQLEKILATTRPDVLHRVWICSDLQHWDPEVTGELLRGALEDYRALALPCEQIWYLGDATDGSNRETQEEVVRVQADLFDQLGLPIYFTFGNHDFDLLRKFSGTVSGNVHAWRVLKERSNWHLMDRPEDFFFRGKLGDYQLYFFGDHAAEDGSWIVTHSKIFGDTAAYPHQKEAWEAIREEMAASPQPVLSIGHYAYPGGNRPSDFMAQLLPLPETVQAHFYGHAHLGEVRLLQENVYRKIAYVDFSNIPQIDVASLERRKGNYVRSVFLEIYRDGTLGIFFRNHDTRVWEEALFLDPRRRS